MYSGWRTDYFSINKTFHSLTKQVLRPILMCIFDGDFFYKPKYLYFLKHTTILKDTATLEGGDATTTLLQQQGVHDFTGLLPQDIFRFSNLLTLRGFIFIVIGGFFVGFGTRYAGGCTSGHSIMGIASLQWPSLVATCCFMAGGFIMTWLILPYLINL